MSKVSVIVAAYNVEKYIANAMNSLISQTLKDIEIVAVDDCSTDATFEMLQKYAELDERVKVVRHSVNKSSMITRKTGVEHANGEYIMFLDGDDMLTADACEIAYKAITTENVDVLQFNTKIFFQDDSLFNVEIANGHYSYLNDSIHKALSFSECGLLDRKQVGGRINFTVWNKIYRREPLKEANQHVPNEYLNMAEDVLLSYLIQYHAKSFAYHPQNLHRYRLGTGISTSVVYSEKRLESLAKCGFVYSYLKQWTKGRGTEELCHDALLQIQRQMFDNITETFFNRIDWDRKNQFISTVNRYCAVEDVLLALSSAMYTRGISESEMARELASLDLFSSEKKQANTIGVYYYRIRNGGVENVLSILTDIWVKRGYQVVLFTDENPSKDDYYIDPHVKRVVLPAMKDRDRDTQEKRIEVFRKELIDHHIDIMVYNAWLNPYLLLDEMIIKSCGTKLIIHTHGLFCSDIAASDGIAAYRNSALHELYSLADSVVTLNDVDTAWWQALGKRCFKTRNPIKMTLDVEPAKLQGNHLLFVGRISPEKQIFDVLKIVKLVKEQVPSVVLSIVGKGDDPIYTKEVDRYIKDHKLTENVILEGFTTNVLPFYQAADVMLCTSKFEGFSLALTESKMCGLPLVAYELPNWDMAREPRGMINVPQGDVRAAADAIVEILQNDDLKKQMGKQARESAEELYSVDLAAHWDMIFAETLKPKPAPVPLYERSPLEAAVNIATDFYTRGLWERSHYASNIPVGSEDVSYYAEQCRVLSKALKEIGESESYRFGLFMTAIPRKIKNWIQRKKTK